MSDRKFVTRGALMQCDKGSHCRRLKILKRDKGNRNDE